MSDSTEWNAPAFLGLDPIAPEDAAFEVIPVPFDGTSTWKKGADRGPAALLEASTQVELYDAPTRSEPWTAGILTGEPVPCARDASAVEGMCDSVEARVERTLRAGRIPVLLGGEHSVSIGAIRAAARVAGDLSVLQIDAHGDTREVYDGSPCNHACVMARAREVAAITQVGIRAVDASEVPALEPDGVFWAHEILDAARAPDAAAATERWMTRVVERQRAHVWLTIDLDAFDPSLMPATGTPEPGGLDWWTVETLVRRVARAPGVRIVGFDVVELLPHEAHWSCDFIAAKLVHRVIAEMVASE